MKNKKIELMQMYSIVGNRYKMMVLDKNQRGEYLYICSASGSSYPTDMLCKRDYDTMQSWVNAGKIIPKSETEVWENFQNTEHYKEYILKQTIDLI